MSACLALAACGAGDQPAAPATDGGSPADAGDGGAGGPDAGPARFPDQVCPGDPECPDEGDGTLHVGVAERDVTMAIPEPWVDVDGNGEYQPGRDTFEDRDGDGEFDGLWIANGIGRAAKGTISPVMVSCLALRQNQTTLLLCAGDLYGYFYDEVVAIRAALDPALGVDLLLINASHNHQSPDPLGQSGPTDTERGFLPEYQSLLREKFVEAAEEAVAALRPATVTYADIDTIDDDGTRHFVSDTRDPIVFTPRLTVLRFDAADGGDTIATLVNWAAHPEYEGLDDNYQSADFPHHLRERMEAALGGVVVYTTGPLGGQVGPGEVCAIDPAAPGVEICDECQGHDCSQGRIKARLVGEQVADFALRALAEDAVTEETAALSFKRRAIDVTIENAAFTTAFLIGLFDRRVYGYDPEVPIDVGNLPLTASEVVSLRIGRLHAITAPGELHPELYLGCYEADDDGFGACSYNWPLVHPDNENPPVLADAPPPPYLRDLMDEDAEYRFVLGLTPDQIGYIVPEWNFEVAPLAPYFEEAPGDHYEETNSVGPQAEREIVGPLRRLLCWRADGTTTAACREALARQDAQDAAAAP